MSDCPSYGDSDLTTNSCCRVCEGTKLEKILDLGRMPLANRFLEKHQLSEPEPTYPLEVWSCADCGLLQLIHVVSPEILFRDYIYVSTTSDTLQQHFAGLAREIVQRYGLNEDSLVLEIASNDGLLLKKFRDLGVRGVGVEPARNIAAMAMRDGIETVNEFFTEATAERIFEKYGAFDAVLGNNVLGHVNRLDDFLRGIGKVLGPLGGISIEVPYVRDLIEHNEYDTIYHEHLSYFSVAVLCRLFERHGLWIYDVERVPIHGGSIRIHGRKASVGRVRTERLERILEEEAAMGLNSLEFQRRFGEKVERTKRSLVELLRSLRAQGKRIAGYGAPAKGNTQLNFCRIGTDLIEYTVDKSPLKQGKYTPGMHIPVYPVEKLLEDQPDYVLIIAWNFADEIQRQQRLYAERGGKFILPIPEPRIV